MLNHYAIIQNMLEFVNANAPMQAIIWQIYNLSGYEHAMATLKGWTR